MSENPGQQEHDAIVEAYVEPKTVAALSVNDETAHKLLRERAALLASIKEEKNTAEENRFIRFRLGEKEEYGIPFEYLQEILIPQEIVPVPCTPKCILGVINRRSEILSVIDLKYFFGIEAATKTIRQWVIVVQHGELKLGVLVDEVIGSESYQAEEISAPVSSADIKNLDYVKGIYDGQVTLLNLTLLLNDSELQL